MIVVDPPGTLLRVTGLCLLSGLCLEALAALLIYLGSTRIPPAIARGRVWAEWRRRRVLWAFSLLSTAAATAFAADWLTREIGLRDLYWLGRPEDLALMCRLAAACGYLLMLLLLVVYALFRRRRHERAGGAPVKTAAKRH